jgi:hypothetical protein
MLGHSSRKKQGIRRKEWKKPFPRSYVRISQHYVAILISKCTDRVYDFLQLQVVFIKQGSSNSYLYSCERCERDD